jgi:hypothetical protein
VEHLASHILGRMAQVLSEDWNRLYDHPIHKRMNAANIPRIDLDRDELLAYLEQARSVLGEDGYRKLKAALEMLHYLTDLVADKNTTIHRLQKILFGARTEKIQNVLENQTGAADGSSQTNAEQEKACTENDKAKEKPKGHGRNGTRDYTGAQRIKISHESLKSGDPCPLCAKGKVYAQKMAVLAEKFRNRYFALAGRHAFGFLAALSSLGSILGFWHDVSWN